MTSATITGARGERILGAGCVAADADGGAGASKVADRRMLPMSLISKRLRRALPEAAVRVWSNT